ICLRIIRGLRRILRHLRISPLVHASAQETKRRTHGNFLSLKWPSPAPPSLHGQEFQCRDATGGPVFGHAATAFQNSFQTGDRALRAGRPTENSEAGIGDGGVRLLSVFYGSFAASTLIFSIRGGLARSSGAFAISAAATFPWR